MTTNTTTEVRANACRSKDAAAESHEAVVITGKRTRAVLVSEEDWRAMQETLFLLSVPDMRESIREGMETPVEDCSETLDW